MILLLAIAVLGSCALYAGVLALLWYFQERIVFQPPASLTAEAVSARRVQYDSRDGATLFAYVIGDCSPTSTVVLAFHGNADIARWLVPWAKMVNQQTNACVVVPEYRGYDGLPGAPSYEGSAHDAQAALTFVRNVLHVSASNTVYFGHSLGSAMATELASVELPRSLVLESPFSSARAMSRRLAVPGLAFFWRLISRVHFDTAARVAILKCPVWVSHGDRDRVTPVRMGREVFAAAAHPGELLIVHGAGHNDVAEVGGSAYWQWLNLSLGAANQPSLITAPQ